MTHDSDRITTGLGEFSKAKLRALLDIRDSALNHLRLELRLDKFTEVTTASLVNIAGSCENPHASFRLPYYGREAHLSQSAQLQLEALVIRLQRDVFTVNTSFREEQYDDPDAEGRRLSEFTLVEAERDYRGFDWGHAFEKLLYRLECIIKRVIKNVLDCHRRDITLLGGDVKYLTFLLDYKFGRIEYEQAIHDLRLEGQTCQIGDDLDIKAERRILEWMRGRPTFVIYHPASLKFFNMCRLWDGHPNVYSFDLLMPPLGETAGGGIRQPVGAKIKQALLESRVGDYLRDQGIDPLEPFAEYFRLFDEEEEINHGGFGIGFERFIAFLINSNDILHTIAHRTLRPD